MAIGINGNQNQINLQKSLKTMQNGKPSRLGTTKKAPGMSMNESIFGQKGVGAKSNVASTATASSVVQANTTRSVQDIQNSKIGTSNNTSKTEAFSR